MIGSFEKFLDEQRSFTALLSEERKNKGQKYELELETQINDYVKKVKDKKKYPKLVPQNDGEKLFQFILDDRKMKREAVVEAMAKFKGSTDTSRNFSRDKIVSGEGMASGEKLGDLVIKINSKVYYISVKNFSSALVAYLNGGITGAAREAAEFLGFDWEQVSAGLGAYTSGLQKIIVDSDPGNTHGSKKIDFDSAEAVGDYLTNAMGFRKATIMLGGYLQMGLIINGALRLKTKPTFKGDVDEFCGDVEFYFGNPGQTKGMTEKNLARAYDLCLSYVKEKVMFFKDVEDMRKKLKQGNGTNLLKKIQMSSAITKDAAASEAKGRIKLSKDVAKNLSMLVSWSMGEPADNAYIIYGYPGKEPEIHRFTPAYKKSRTSDIGNIKVANFPTNSSKKLGVDFTAGDKKWFAEVRNTSGGISFDKILVGIYK